MQRLVEYSWPGNIRELENVLERAVILASEETLEIGPDLLPLSKSAPTAPPGPGLEPSPINPLTAVLPPTADQSQFSLEAVERNHILAVLQQVNWVITGRRGAAKLLDLPPSTLRNRMKKLGITRDTDQIQ
jgi:transcriptional regulator with GAF, ATPase, and Fis domain